MPTPIAMPKLGMTMSEGAVLEWPAAVGERVEKGQTVVVIESEKAQFEVEATASGFLRHVYVAPDPDVPVPCGTVLGAITERLDEPFDAEAFRREHDRRQTKDAFAAQRSPSPLVTAEPSARPRRAPVAPAARALGRQLGVDLERVPGSGPGGRVTKEDVEAWAVQRERLVQVAPGIALEVPTEGDGDPVILLPGFGTDVSAFAAPARALALRYRVRAVNPRGVGLSDAPEQERYDVADLAADAAALIDAPTHVVGASLGAAIAIELALAQVEKVRTLTLITPFVQADARLLAVLDAWCRVAAEASADTTAATLLPWLFSAAFLTDEAARRRTARGLASIVRRTPAAVLRRYFEGVRAWSSTRRSDLERIQAPTLVLVAAADLLTPGGEAVAQAIPGATCAVMTGAGHALALEAPEAVTDAILAHLR
jgi:pyruvate dehydrogenase E2 component (dihydrolipoamide acetyltransferase)